MNVLQPNPRPAFRKGDGTMRTYVFYFALIVLVANLGYAFSQLGSEQPRFVSIPLLFGSVSAAIFALVMVRKRLRQSKGSERK